MSGSFDVTHKQVLPKVFLPSGPSATKHGPNSDLWQGNICGVRCTTLWLMINGHITLIFVKNSMNAHFQ
jgi:hypothetical protein